MAAYADGTFGNQTLFTRFFATNIMQDALAIRNYDVRDDLLEVWVGFGLGAGLKTVVLLVEDDRQITVHISPESLKSA